VPKGCYACPNGSGELAGTGMQIGNTGGATNWLTTDAPIVHLRRSFAGVRSQLGAVHELYDQIVA